ncbi:MULTISPECIES: sigma factor-like helix-turn-helix DNA-binding protein [Pontibacillus]|uniref:Sigma factor-like helix-turn-helix DNA-binding protein n=1 Tax=Pontibacillus chungwhensis TaxID=265426 RepID=A0ABY8V3T0_9BACI|nr:MULTISPECIES: sigma factor-like helix-turn-helix DNA-binding protein [Pontibacillus]MCD5324458.1 hypothetical protein [Pontibacillus sp. HN14]WIF99249.1 sigma factor-like helix-turn-helix DNA-binding protein [Pontibacillus chungwhensis]
MTTESLFSFMKEVAPDFVTLGEKIEASLFEQPNSTLVQARLFGEHLGKLVAKHEGTEEVFSVKHVERLEKLLRREAIEEDIFNKFNWLRKMGNKAAHEPNFGEVEVAIRAHRIIYDLSCWYVQLYISFDFAVPEYSLPKPRANQGVDKEELANMLQPLLNDSLQSVVGQQWAEMKKEIEELKKLKEEPPKTDNENDGEKVPQPKVKEETKSEVKEKSFALFSYLKEHGLEVLDKRANKGAIWVVGNWSLKEILFPLKKYNIYFRFAKKGSKSTKRRPAWFMLSKWRETEEEEKARLFKSEEKVEESKVDEISSNSSKEDETKESYQLPETEETYSEQAEYVVKEDQTFIVQLAPVNKVDYTQKEQLFVPNHLLNTPIESYAETALSLLKDKGIQFVADVDEDILRDLYRTDREFFYQVVQHLFVLGVDFTEKLSQFKPVVHFEGEDKVIVVRSQEHSAISSWLPKLYTQRFAEVGIRNTNQLNGLFLSSLKWLFKELYGEVLTFLSQHEETWVEEGEEPFETHVPAENAGSISLDNEWISIDANLREVALNTTNFQGVRALVRQLQEKGFFTLNDLPENLDDLHLQFKGVGPGAVQKLWNQIALMSKSINTKGENGSQFEQGTMVVFEDYEIEIPEIIRTVDIETDRFLGVKSILEQFGERGIRVYGDLPVDLESITSWPKIGKTRVKQFFEQLVDIMETVKNELMYSQKLNQMTAEERFHYYFTKHEELVSKLPDSVELQKKHKITPRQLKLMEMKYKAFKRGDHLTLEEMGEALGVTRERVRQVIAKFNERLFLQGEKWVNEVQQMLKHSQVIANKWLDRKTFTHYMMGECLNMLNINFRLEDLYLTSYNSEEYENVKKSIYENVKDFFHQKVFTRLELEDWAEALSHKLNIPSAFIKDVSSPYMNWFQNGEGVLTTLNKADVVEMVMAEYPQGVEIFRKEDELIEKANQIMPGQFGGERSFTSIVSNREDAAHKFLMWGRGTYIYHQFVHPDIDWLAQVQYQALDFLSKVSTVNIHKLFRVVKEEAIERGIPNEYALYTLLRQHPIEEVDYLKFPKISLAGVELRKNVEWIREFIHEYGEPVPYDVLRNEFVHERGWKEFTLQHNLWNDDSIIQYKHAHYTLMSYFEHIPYDFFRPIIQRLEELLEDQTIIQIGRVFEEKKTYLASEGIVSSYLLYQTLERLYEGPLDFARYPYLTNGDINKDDLSITSLVEDYLIEAGGEVPREEVYQWITEELGGHEKILDNVLQKSNDIFYYTRGQYGEYVHRDVIDWNEEKQEQLHQYCLARLNELLGVRDLPIITIGDLFNPNDLPPLDNYVPWTEDLLTDCLKNDHRWELIGSYNWIVAAFETVMPYSSNPEFITYILTSQFNSSAKVHDFYRYLRQVKYSQDGALLSEAEDLLEEDEAPFTIEGDEIVMKLLKETTHES